MIRAVFFDLDNTLVDRSASIDKFSMMLTEQFASHLSPLTTPEQVATLIKDINNGGYLPQTSPYQTIWQAVGSGLHQSLLWSDPVSVATLESFWRENFPASSVETEGASELLGALCNLGYYLGIISNGAELSRYKTVAATSFAALISRITSSEAFGAAKPDPSIFIETAQAAGFSPEECLYVGDHPVKDIEGALDAGMSAIMLSGFHPELPVPEAAKVVNHLSEVLPLINAQVNGDDS